MDDKALTHEPGQCKAFQEELAHRTERLLMEKYPSLMNYVDIVCDEEGWVKVYVYREVPFFRRLALSRLLGKTHFQLQGEFGTGLYSVWKITGSHNVEGSITDSSTLITPPRFGERLLLLVLRTREERVNIPGDLEEEYRGMATKHGERFAKVWYYKQVAASAWPMIQKAVRWGLLVSALEWVRRLI